MWRDILRIVKQRPDLENIETRVRADFDQLWPMAKLGRCQPTSDRSRHQLWESAFDTKLAPEFHQQCLTLGGACPRLGSRSTTLGRLRPDSVDFDQLLTDLGQTKADFDRLRAELDPERLIQHGPKIRIIGPESTKLWGRVRLDSGRVRPTLGRVRPRDRKDNCTAIVSRTPCP